MIIDYWLLTVDCWLLIVDCWLLIVDCWLLLIMIIISINPDHNPIIDDWPNQDQIWPWSQVGNPAGTPSSPLTAVVAARFFFRRKPWDFVTWGFKIIQDDSSLKFIVFMDIFRLLPFRRMGGFPKKMCRPRPFRGGFDFRFEVRHCCGSSATSGAGGLSWGGSNKSWVVMMVCDGLYMVYIWLMDWDGGSQQLGLGFMSQLLGILMDFGHYLVEMSWIPFLVGWCETFGHLPTPEQWMVFVGENPCRHGCWLGVPNNGWKPQMEVDPANSSTSVNFSVLKADFHRFWPIPMLKNSWARVGLFFLRLEVLGLSLQMCQWPQDEGVLDASKSAAFSFQRKHLSLALVISGLQMLLPRSFATPTANLLTRMFGDSCLILKGRKWIQTSCISRTFLLPQVRDLLSTFQATLQCRSLLADASWV